MPRQNLNRDRRRRRAHANVRAAVVSIGINYTGQSGALGGCQNDSDNFLRMVRMRLGRAVVWQRQLKDSLPRSHALCPTRANIERVLLQAVKQCRQRKLTHLLVHYSGHGSQRRDRSGEEADGRDETWVPVDHARAGEITDDWLLAKCVVPLPATTQAFWLLDCCHSGSQLDLRWALEPRSGGRLRRRLANRACPQAPNAVLLSGCRDHRYSYDAWDAKHGPTGAMSVAFLRAFLANPGTPLAKLLLRMRRDLKQRNYPQIPQLSATRPLGAFARVPGLSW